jgi:hypothetical protein
MGGGLYGCFLCECKAVELALFLFSVDCFSDFNQLNMKLNMD